MIETSVLEQSLWSGPLEACRTGRSVRLPAAWWPGAGKGGAVPATPYSSPVGFGCGLGAGDLGVGYPPVGVCAAAQANWDAVVNYVGACAPDLVIHLGDLSLDGAGNAVDLRHGRAQLDRLPVAWRAVPGNHDIGDNPWPGAPAGIAVDAARHQRWLDIVGADHWSVTAGGWVVMAVNAQLLGSGLACRGGAVVVA